MNAHHDNRNRPSIGYRHDDRPNPRWQEAYEDFEGPNQPPVLDFYPAPQLRGNTRIKPDPYDGSEDFDYFDEHFENIALLSGWSPAEKTLMLSTVLKGAARKFYNSLSNSTKYQYETLLQSLRQRFGCKGKHHQFYLAKLQARTRKPGESAAALADDLLLLAQQAYPYDMTDYNLNKTALCQFYNSLEPELRWSCIEKRFAFIEEAVEFVELFEAFNQTTPAAKKVRQIQSSENWAPRAYDALLERICAIERQASTSGSAPRPMNQPYQANQLRGGNFHNSPKQQTTPMMNQNGENFNHSTNQPFRQMKPQNQGSGNVGPSQTPQTQANQSGERGPYPRSQRRCFCCQSVDHTLAFCPVYQSCKQYEEKYASGNNRPLN